MRNRRKSSIQRCLPTFPQRSHANVAAWRGFIDIELADRRATDKRRSMAGGRTRVCGSGATRALFAPPIANLKPANAPARDDDLAVEGGFEKNYTILHFTKVGKGKTMAEWMHQTRWSRRSALISKLNNRLANDLRGWRKRCRWRGTRS